MPNLRKINRELLQLLEAIRTDMLMRGTKDEDGTAVVEMSNGLWRRINDALNGQVPESLGLPDPIGKLPEHHKQWFEQLKKAMFDGNVALMAGLDAKTMEPRSILALVSHEDGEFLMTPVGHLCPADNPYEAYIPPRTEQETVR